LSKETKFPGSHRHHGPPLAGFAVSGLLYLRKHCKAGHGNRAAPVWILVLFLIRVEPNFQADLNTRAGVADAGRESFGF
jgi:hypothetical protein